MSNCTLDNCHPAGLGHRFSVYIRWSLMPLRLDCTPPSLQRLRRSPLIMRKPFRLALLSATLGTATVLGVDLNYTETCKTIAGSVSSASEVYYFGALLSLTLRYILKIKRQIGHPRYVKGNSHWASSSSQNSACVVEPANAADVSTIVSAVAHQPVASITKICAKRVLLHAISSR
jgi:hypothetical protein